MKKLFVAFILAAAAYASPLFALDVPALKGYVNDYAQMMTPETAAKLEARLKAFEDSDSTQVVILTIPSLEGEALEDYCIKVAEAWKIGQSKKDNGVIFFVSKNDRRMRIEVGRGLEGVLTDLKSGRIIDNVISPRFRDGDFDSGFTDGANAIISTCRGEFKNDGTSKKVKKERPLGAFIIFLFIGLYFAVVVSHQFSKIASIGIGAAGLPAILHFAVLPLGLIGLLAAAAVGIAAAFLLPLIPVGSGSRGGYHSSGGSSFGGGGFSGGGGSFGGGGSSGGW